MAVAQSQLTAQGQISVPAEIRKKLGLGPGSVLEWEDKLGEVVVRKAGHPPLGSFDRQLAKLEGAQRL